MGNFIPRYLFPLNNLMCDLKLCFKTNYVLQNTENFLVKEIYAFQVKWKIEVAIEFLCDSMKYFPFFKSVSSLSVSSMFYRMQIILFLNEVFVQRKFSIFSVRFWILKYDFMKCFKWKMPSNKHKIAYGIFTILCLINKQ